MHTAASDPREIRRRVHDYYAKLAQQLEGDCCHTPSECCDLLTGTETPPRAAAPPSLGCGNPVSAAGLRPGERVLDLGSGAGRDSLLAAELVGPAGVVIGVDMTHEMVARARDFARQADSTNLTFRQGTMEAVPLADRSMDVVLSNCAINLSSEKPKVFAELYRVLRPGGRAVIADVVSLGSLHARYSEREGGWEACISGALSLEAYEEGLRAVGFERLSVKPVGDATLDTVPAGVPFSALIRAHRPVGS
jgi:SAM-dependent methyltransferase